MQTMSKNNDHEFEEMFDELDNKSNNPASDL